MSEHPNIYTPDSLAERWDCSASQIRKMCANGDLPAFRLGTKLWRIKPQDVEAYENRDVGPLAAKDLEQDGPFVVARLKAEMRQRRLLSRGPG